MTTPAEIADALADALLDVSPSEDITVWPRMLFSPTPPAIDIYPGEPAEGYLAFSPSRTHFFTVRIRVASSDTDGQQDLLLASRETTGPNSVREALRSDPTLGGIADGIQIDGPTGYQLWQDSNGVIMFVGHTWTVAVHASETAAS